MCCEFVFEICTYLCFETSCRRRREKISLNDRVKDEVLHRVKEEMNVLQTIKRKEANWFCHSLLSKCLLNTLLK
jgi:chromosome condensin MukBEF complex kleisin-like MukF subunit